MDELKTVFPEKPIFYVTQPFYEQYFKGREGLYPDHHLWLRSIAEEPVGEACRPWTIWQFADNGMLDGIEGPVDLNALCPSDAAFSHLFSKAAQ